MMSLFQIMASIGLLALVVGLGVIAWFLRQLVVRPERETKAQEKRTIEADVERAKLELFPRDIETRMTVKTDESEMNGQFEKLKELRRRK